MNTQEYKYCRRVNQEKLEGLLNEQAQEGWAPCKVIPFGDYAFDVVLERRKPSGCCGSLKKDDLMSDYDILTKWMKYSHDEANEMLSRKKIQKLEDLKLQVMAQNPQLLGVGLPPNQETVQ